MIVYCRDKYYAQRMCDNAVNDSLASNSLEVFVPKKNYFYIFMRCETILFEKFVE